MRNRIDSDALTAIDSRIAITEISPESTYISISVPDQYETVEAYRSFEIGGTVPQALEAYIDFHQRQWM